MKIRVLGAGWYGCHLALSLIEDGHSVILEEMRGQLFRGASGSNPARLHLGFHYPRSHLTRAACQEHTEEFLTRYGFLTRNVPVNIYAIAEHESMVDFGTYLQVLQGEVPFVPIDDPSEYGLANVEGALLTGERHIVIDVARQYFESKLSQYTRFGVPYGTTTKEVVDWTIDCTFCALDQHDVDRYEPCLVVLLQGPTDKAVTIMDGPFPSLYPWDEQRNLCSLSSARWTPFSKTCRTWADATEVLNCVGQGLIEHQTDCMIESMARFYPAIKTDYQVEGHLLSIRAMPKSGADARLVDVQVVRDRTLRVRAGKIDAIMRAERLVKEFLDA